MLSIDICTVWIFLSSQFPTFAITWKYLQQNRRPSSCYFGRQASEILAKRARWSYKRIRQTSRCEIPRRPPNGQRSAFSLAACSKLQQRILSNLNKCERLGRIRETRKKNARVTGFSVDLVSLPRCAYVNRFAYKGTNRLREATTETEREEKIGKVEQPAIQRDREGRAYARLLCMHLKRGRGP